MRRELANAERRTAVREATREWRKANLIDDRVLREIESLEPDDRISKPAIWRVLIFFFSCVILCSFFGLILATNNPSRGGLTVLALFFGVALAIATEFQQGPLRFRGTGGEAATSLLSITFLVTAAINGIEPPDARVKAGIILLISAVLFSAGWWRWGFPLYALFSAVLLFFAVSSLVPFPRLAWLALAALLALPCGLLQDRPGLAPAHRIGAQAVLAAALSAGYAAVNLYSFDYNAIEELRVGPPAAGIASPLVRMLFAAATALFPPAVLIAGVRARRRLLIDLGVGFGAFSLVTLHAYVHLGPLWLVLTEAGVVLVLFALWAEKFLSRGRDRERFGLTSEPLFEDARRAQLLSAAAVVATFSPAGRAGPAETLSPGGGGFGGGGANGEL